MYYIYIVDGVWCHMFACTSMDVYVICMVYLPIPNVCNVGVTYIHIGVTNPRKWQMLIVLHTGILMVCYVCIYACI